QQEIRLVRRIERRGPLGVILERFLLENFHAVLGGLWIEQIVQVGVPYVFDTRLRGGGHHDVIFIGIAARLHLVRGSQQIEVYLKTAAQVTGRWVAQVRVDLQDGA